MVKSTYGGQAVPEGVMFQSQSKMVTAIRRNDASIEFFETDRPRKQWIETMKKIPILRGNIALLESTTYGMKHMDFASDRYDRNPEDDYKINEEKNNENRTKILMTSVLIGVITFIVGKLIFTLVPVFIAETFSNVITGRFEQVLLESLIKLTLLLSYIYFISMTPMVKRLFQYHGAEHKVINTYENNVELTVQNVKNHSRLHYRCGSSFILFTVIVGFIVYMFVPVDPFWFRVISRVLLLPIVIGLSFEFLKFTNALRHIPVLKYLGLPGLWLQLLTTKEPDESQIEVSIQSFKKLLRSE